MQPAVVDLLEYDDAGGAIVFTSPGAGSSGIGLWSSLEKDGHLERPETYEEDLMLLDTVSCKTTGKTRRMCRQCSTPRASGCVILGWLLIAS